MDCPQKQQNPVLLFLPPKGHTTFWLVELGLFPHYAFIWHKKDRFCYGGKPNYHPIPTYKVHPIKWGHSGGGPWAVVKLRWSARVWPRGRPKARSWVRWSALGTLASPKALRGAWGQEVRKGEGEKPRCACLSMSLFALIFQQQNRKFVNWRQIKLIETPPPTQNCFVGLGLSLYLFWKEEWLNCLHHYLNHELCGLRVNE